MPKKRYKPITPSLRQRETFDFSELSPTKKQKNLYKSLKNNAGRNNSGKISVRHRGGGSKRHFRIIDFKRNKFNIPGKVVSIEYDPNRSSFISLIHYIDGEKRFIISPNKLKVGTIINSSEQADIKIGNTKKIKDIPVGTPIHNIELHKGKGAQLVRSAGTSATVTGRQEKFVTVKLPSGEVRLINNECLATIGQVSKPEHKNLVLGKAGVNRWKRKRPTVRGSVMNACDHPHGGGEGRAPVGQPSPRTPWGKPAIGYKTNKNKLQQHIVSRRK